MISKRSYENLITNQNKIDERIEIKIKMYLDENNVPEQIHWSAEDSGEINQKAEAF